MKKVLLLNGIFGIVFASDGLIDPILGPIDPIKAQAELVKLKNYQNSDPGALFRQLIAKSTRRIQILQEARDALQEKGHGKYFTDLDAMIAKKKRKIEFFTKHIADCSARIAQRIEGIEQYLYNARLFEPDEVAISMNALREQIIKEHGVPSEDELVEIEKSEQKRQQQLEAHVGKRDVVAEKFLEELDKTMTPEALRKVIEEEQKSWSKQ